MENNKVTFYTICGMILSRAADSIISTICLAIIGATTSFLLSLLFKWITKKYKL